MNMIWIDDTYRNKGLGKKAVLFWEDEMKKPYQWDNITNRNTMGDKRAL
ncbi:hypothetical protein [Paenibacillus tundrae]|nr:hypothetical protein [Paenibacillus tundrae]